ncbi:GNAT family N-acetyltransferase [Gimesia algae]|uniref:Putative acetyltransferase n=1 Tax=Gimesia algae TaxID=2527971 RepID=A0A517VDH4_9PLAN|nr:GNAT family N-acetyltransferase [Gimesia algae]QDT91051.1 putative acetyltransferase [Gimesia algae]
MQILEADLTNPEHASALVSLLNSYACSPEGGGTALPADVQHNLAAALLARPDASVLLAFADETPIGLMTCIEGFSTFACKPLMNIHDVYVSPDFRGQGIAGQLFAHVESIAKIRGCCKLTLEVLQGNQRAQAVYARLGFSGYELTPEMGHALFWEKKL